MKTLGICIVCSNNNYGSMLQSFATLRLLGERDIKFEVIRYIKCKNANFVIKSIPRLFNRIVWSDKKMLIQKKLNLSLRKDFKKHELIREKVFENFRNHEFKKYYTYFHGYSALKAGSLKYDGVLVGSDQLWSPSGLPTNFYNLQFVEHDTPKISYASSFGVKDIPNYQIRRTQNYLKRIEYISTRENNGKRIIKELINRDVPVVLDPTLMLTSDQWDNYVVDGFKCKEPYIFAYFLGTNLEHRLQVTKLSNDLNIKIVTLRHLDQYVKEDEEFGDYAPYNIDPLNFISLIKNALYVCTDSFHGSVFSILYHKKFVTMNRYSKSAKDSKNSRIDSLLSNLGLEDRRYSDNHRLIDIIKREINYIDVEKRLTLMRDSSNMYLNNALKFMGDSND